MTAEPQRPDVRGGPAVMERGGGIALWRQIAERLRADIAAGAWPEGTRLPSEAELALRFGVNRHTVRRAVAALSGEGLLRADRGRGTFLAGGRLLYPIGPRTRFSEIVSAQAREPGGRLIGHSREAADLWVASRLEVTPGTPVLRLETLRVADGVPISASLSWFPADRFANLISVYAETGSVSRALAAHGAGDYVRRSTRIAARAAGPDEFGLLGLLGLGPEAIVFVVESVNVDAAGVPVEAALARFAADRVELELQPADGAPARDCTATAPRAS